MKIEICIPAFNEERVIAEVAQQVLSVFSRAGRNVSVIVSDNASTDATADIARKIKGVSVLSTPLRGKGSAVIEATRQSDADIFGFIDADLSADPHDIISFLSLIERDESDVVIGSRLVAGGTVNRSILRTLSSKLFNVCRRAIVGVTVKDTQCGMKVMNARGRKLLSECEETGWFFDIEFLARAERAGLRIQEVPIRWDEQRFAGRESKLNLFRDSIGALRAMFRIRRAMNI